MTLLEADAFLAACKTAYLGALAGKQVRYNGRDVTYHDLAALRDEFNGWEKTVKDLTASANGATNPGVRISTWT